MSRARRASSAREAPASHGGVGASAFAFVALVMLGLCLGLASHALGFTRPHGKLFQILIGLPLAIAAAPLIWKGYISRRWACLCVAAGAVFAFAHQHVLEYREFPRAYASRMLLVLEGQALQDLLADIRKLSRAVDDIARGFENLSPESRARITAAQRSHTASKGEIEAMSKSADDFAAAAKDADLAPLLARHRDDWERIRDKIKAGGVQQMGLGDESSREADRRVLRDVEDVLSSFRFGEYLSAKADQGARFRWFGKEHRLRRGATIAWWLLEIVLAALLGCLLVSRVAVNKDLNSA
jgi:hypothetical protein